MKNEKAKWVKSIKALEKMYDDQEKRQKGTAIWWIKETPNWYIITLGIEVGIFDAEAMARYKTESYDECIEFCENHCNHGDDYIGGIGCTEIELVKATERYLHSLGRKVKYEGYEEYGE